MIKQRDVRRRLQHFTVTVAADSDDKIDNFIEHH